MRAWLSNTMPDGIRPPPVAEHLLGDEHRRDVRGGGSPGFLPGAHPLEKGALADAPVPPRRANRPCRAAASGGRRSAGPSIRPPPDPPSSRPRRLTYSMDAPSTTMSRGWYVPRDRPRPPLPLPPHDARPADAPAGERARASDQADAYQSVASSDSSCAWRMSWPWTWPANAPATTTMVLVLAGVFHHFFREQALGTYRTVRHQGFLDSIDRARTPHNLPVAIYGFSGGNKKTQIFTSFATNGNTTSVKIAP